jgi:hypothetical protein
MPKARVIKTEITESLCTLKSLLVQGIGGRQRGQSTSMIIRILSSLQQKPYETAHTRCNLAI